MTGSETKCKSLVIDNRHMYGEPAPPPALPHGETGELIPDNRTVLYLGANGYIHDVAEANRYLRPGRAYQVEAFQVGRSASTLSLKDFDGIDFNTVMFTDWPSGEKHGEA